MHDPLTAPLKAEHFDALQTASRLYHDLLAEFDKADSCGVGCQQMRSEALQHKNAIDKLLIHYFPQGRPTD